jgi:hypothetical protein
MYHSSVWNVLRFFEFAHLPEPLRGVSEQFAKLAHSLADNAPTGPELVVALRKLLESKDAAVRAKLPMASQP